MIIYLNKAGAKPVMIFCTVLHAIVMILLLIGLFAPDGSTDTLITILILIGVFSLFHALAMYLLRKEASDKKNYLCVKETCFEIHAKGIEDGKRPAEIPFSEIELIEYFSVTSLLSWLAVFQIAATPKSVLMYIHPEGAQKRTIHLGCMEKKDVIEICKQHNIPLKIH